MSNDMVMVSLAVLERIYTMANRGMCMEIREELEGIDPQPPEPVSAVIAEMRAAAWHEPSDVVEWADRLERACWGEDEATVSSLESV